MILRCHALLTDKANALLFSCIIAVFLLNGCTVIMRSATSEMMIHLTDTIVNNDDLDMVKDGAPAYLLMIDSLIRKDPENEKMLYMAANLYTSYANLFVDDPERSKNIARKALSYAQKAMCQNSSSACHLKSMPFDRFEKTIHQTGIKQLPALFSLGNAWARWIMANADDLDAIADIARIETIMNQVIALDETFQDGAAYLYLGTLSSFLPPALGGKPEQAKKMFEKARSISNGKNLTINLLYAKYYARMIFDRALHDQLLNQVLTTNPDIPNHTLVNTWAQHQAKELLNSADDYF
jgi:tetratricopeptide (TPR) repeat protein